MLKLYRVKTYVVSGFSSVLDTDHVVDIGGGLVSVDYPVMDIMTFTSLCQGNEGGSPAITSLINMIVLEPDHRVVGDFLSLEFNFIPQINIVLKILMILKLILKVVAVEKVVEVGDISLVSNER